MRLKDFIEKTEFSIINLGSDSDKELSKVFCCDLLSIAMSKAPAASVWVTVMGNVNAVAVTVLTEIGCIILAENITLDDNALQKAKQESVTVLKSNLPVFDTGLIAHNAIDG